MAPLNLDGKITVLTVNYHSEDVILNCLSPFYKRIGIVVVDNASTRESLQFLENNYPDITIVRNERNVGYGAGFNSGLTYVRSPYILALSPDAEFSMEKLEQLIQYAETYENSAMVSPTLDVPNQSIETWVMGPNELIHSKASFDASGPFCTWFSSGAVSIYRTDLLQTIGGFDERIFLYNEDLDLCIRLRRAGYSIVIVPTIVATHLNSRSAPRSTRLHWRKDWILPGVICTSSTNIVENPPCSVHL